MTSRVIVITGASSGIGASLAKQSAARGDKVVLAARREAELKSVAKECGADAMTAVTDVTHRVDVEILRDEAIKRFGHIDVWVNNAGRGIGRQVIDLTDDDVDQMIAVNLKSALYGRQAVIPHFKERGDGHLINVSSALGRIPFASFRSIYSASKAALNSLTANLRMDLRAEYPNIHVSVVMPPGVATDFAKNALHGTPGGTRHLDNAPTADEVAVSILDLIDHPKAEIYTSPEMAETIARYYSDVGAFEEQMGKR
ncbi:MAG: SDR family NAD(P)-dependent oxidoreductase [Anaerolineales bacterium]